MKRRGATTVGENWDGGGSHNHPMFGASARFLFTGILGIRPTENAVAYNEFVIAPQLPEKLDFAKGKLTLPCGEVAVSMERKNASVHFAITLPENKEADFVFGEVKNRLHGGLNEFVI